MDTNKLTDNRANLAQKVLETRNYDMFRLKGENRKVSTSHVQSLISSMEENPKLFRYRPILVTEEFDVMDGQHRLAAARHLKIPVFYTVAIGMDMKDTRRINATQRAWGPTDYAESFATEGKRPYQRYLALREEFGVGHNTLMSFMMSNKGRQSLSNTFKSGRLVEVNEKQTDHLLSLIAEVEEIAPGYASRANFCQAFKRMALTEGYDHEHFLRQYKRYHEKHMRPFLRLEDYTRALEYIYNEMQRDDKRLRLY